MQKYFLLLILLSLSQLINSQVIQSDLNGYRLGQFRDVPKNEIKTILKKDKFEDGYEYEIYLIEPDTSVYMIFEYAKSDLNIIWSIQLTGSKPGYDCNFKGLKLGMSSDEVIDILGKPSDKINIAEYGKRWEYEKTNYSVETNPKNRLSSIKIMDLSNDIFSEPDLSKIPSFQQYSDILKSSNNLNICDILAPDIEIYKNDSVYFFKKSIETEIQADESGIFKLINEMNGIIKIVNSNDTLQYEENIRLVEGQNPMHVAKFRVNNNYSELVFKWMFGKYLIWEMKIN